METKIAAKKNVTWCVYRKVAVIAPTTACVVIAMMSSVIFLHSEEMRTASSYGSDARLTKQHSVAAVSLVMEVQQAVHFLKSEGNFSLTKDMRRLYDVRIAMSDIDVKATLDGRGDANILESSLTDLYAIRSDIQKFSLAPATAIVAYWKVVNNVLRGLTHAAAPTLGPYRGLMCAMALSASTSSVAAEATTWANFPNGSVAAMFQASYVRSETLHMNCDQATVRSITQARAYFILSNAIKDIRQSLVLKELRIPRAPPPLGVNQTAPPTLEQVASRVSFIVQDYDNTEPPSLTFYIGTFVGCSIVIAFAAAVVVLQIISLKRHNPVHIKEIFVENEVTKLIESHHRIRILFDQVLSMETADKKQFRPRTPIEKSLSQMIHPFDDHCKYLHPTLVLPGDPATKQGMFDNVRLSSRRVTILCISLQHFHNRVSTESAAQKSMATQVQKFLSYVFELCVVQQGGIFHKNTGNILTILWGLDVGGTVLLDDYTAVACEAAQQLAKNTSDSNIVNNLRAGVCTGDCLTGVVGNDVIKSVVVIGPSVALAAMLVKLASTHEAQIVLDQRTLQYLDVQKFKGRPLEKVEVQGTKTTAFELILAQMEKDSKTTSWIEVFDAYSERKREKGLELIETLTGRAVTSASLRRMQNILKEVSPMYVTTRPTSETCVVEEELL